ncbi:MAG: hypothetical protein JWN52_4963 [Actinomycetia bacterium]|nr:hypothetical protein [Actinomycetes bacterium]
MSHVAAAVAFTWFGMVVAISFLETPLKFRAPGITLGLGLGIGRLVFRALNLAEAVLALALAAWLIAGRSPTAAWVPAAVAWTSLTVQIAVLRPRLDRRSLIIIAGGDPPPSHLHLGYIALELIKVLALPTAGALAVA